MVSHEIAAENNLENSRLKNKGC